MGWLNGQVGKLCICPSRLADGDVQRSDQSEGVRSL
jgi:hypothetical protein